MRALAVFAILTTMTLAGCASEKPDGGVGLPEPDPVYTLDDLSQKVFDILPVVEEWVTMDDGQRMHNAVYRPDTNESVPVFINFSPYWGDTAELGGDAFSQYMIDEYVPRGYAVVLTALRGTGHSEGCFSIGGDRELRDMHDVVDHYANAAWSNGNIATGGKSYDSSPTNGLIAKFPHPALKGVFHVSGITDMYAYNYHGGVPYTTGPVFNTYYYLQGTDEYGVSLVGAGTANDEDAESLARLIDDVACPDLPFVQAHGIGSGVTGMKTDYWQERDWAQFIGDSDWDGSIFFVHGLQDWNVKPDHILPWINNLPEQIRVKGWLHQGAHVYPERTDWNQTMLRWMDHELKGIDTGFWAEPAWDVRGIDGLWRESEAWPPAMVEASLAFVGATSSAISTATYRIDVEALGMANQTGYTRISGSPLIHVTPNYVNADPVATATLHLNGQWVGEAFLRVLYRDGLEMPSPVVPGSFETISLQAYPLDIAVGPDDDLTVTFGGTPRNGLATPAQAAGILWDGSLSPLGPTIELPIANADARADQPTDMRCFAC